MCVCACLCIGPSRSFCFAIHSESAVCELIDIWMNMRYIFSRKLWTRNRFTFPARFVSLPLLLCVLCGYAGAGYIVVNGNANALSLCCMLYGLANRGPYLLGYAIADKREQITNISMHTAQAPYKGILQSQCQHPWGWKSEAEKWEGYGNRRDSNFHGVTCCNGFIACLLLTILLLKYIFQITHFCVCLGNKEQCALPGMECFWGVVELLGVSNYTSLKISLLLHLDLSTMSFVNRSAIKWMGNGNSGEFPGIFNFFWKWEFYEIDNTESKDDNQIYETT